jgi:hypothetical protein
LNYTTSTKIINRILLKTQIRAPWSTKFGMLCKQTCRLIITLYRKPLHSLAKSSIMSVPGAHPSICTGGFVVTVQPSSFYKIREQLFIACYWNPSVQIIHEKCSLYMTPQHKNDLLQQFRRGSTTHAIRTSDKF